MVKALDAAPVGGQERQTLMDSRPQPALADQLAAAMDWWREAGVDCDFLDDPQKLLSEPDVEKARARPAPRPAPAKPAPPPPPKLGGDRENWPADLDAFRRWWMTEPTLDDAPLATRVPPQGLAKAELMILVPMPEAEDRETLLSGRQGELVRNMLRAMGIGEERAYIAAALPRHMPAADWAQMTANGMGAVLLHHIQLVAPQRLLVLGRDVLPLLGLARSQKPQALTADAVSLQALASYSPDSLLQNARLRAGLWRGWLEWTGNGE